MPRLLSIIGSILLVLLGAALLAVIQSASGIQPGLKNDLSFGDFAGIILTALGVMLAALAIFLGALAVIGWASFETMVERGSNAYLDKRFSPDDDRYIRLVEEIKEDVRREISIVAQSKSQDLENTSLFDESAV